MRSSKAKFWGDVGESVTTDKVSDDGLLTERLFGRMLTAERKRTERSGRRFLVMLVERPGNKSALTEKRLVSRLGSALAKATRDTDLKGWYRNGSVLGVIFTEMGPGEAKAVVRVISAKVTAALYDALSISEINELRLSFHLFPEDWEEERPDGPATSTLQLALGEDSLNYKAYLAVKRMMDIAGSMAALTLCLPLFVAIMAAVRLTSKGPMLFRQQRLGQYGRKFTFLKFRSMYVNTDQSIHEEYVKTFIAGAGSAAQGEPGQKIFKLTADPRITPVGRFLRKTSLDELPQFFNVLMGDMSLVGPRPPLPYEYERYHLWHKQRLFIMKPGITGLWQVEGRSRVLFDEMVRLDIRYMRSRSLWLDAKILLQTPRAMVSGNGAC